MQSLNKNLEDSLKGSELADIGLDLSEIAIDSLLNDGLLKDIPIVKIFVSLFNAGVGIKDALYIKKLLLFIGKVQEVPKEKRVEFLKEISKVIEEKNRLFEKILFTIDKLDESGKALLLGKVFKHLIVGNITLIQYYKASRVIEDMLLDEINYFLYQYGYFEINEEYRQKNDYYFRLIGKDNLQQALVKNDLYEVEHKLLYRKKYSR